MNSITTTQKTKVGLRQRWLIAFFAFSLAISPFISPRKYPGYNLSERKYLGKNSVIWSSLYLTPVSVFGLWHFEKEFHRNSRGSLYQELPDHRLVIDNYEKTRYNKLFFFVKSEKIIDFDYYNGIGNINLYSFRGEDHTEWSKRADDAIDNYKKAIEYNPGASSLINFKIGQAYLYSGRKEQAVKHFITSLSLADNTEKKLYYAFLRRQ
ncbi:MAG: hypothetical protein QM758_09125 [Armatimonas sp.]